jgi:hypothetical protein
MIPLICLMLVALVSAVAVMYYHQTNVTVTVSEALSSTEVNMIFNATVGETVGQDITIYNSADDNLKTTLTWFEDYNPNGVTYEMDLPTNKTLVPGINTIQVGIHVLANSNIGTFNGTIKFARVA